MSEEAQDYTPEIIETGAQADTPSPISEDALRNAIGDDGPSDSIDEALEKAFAKAQSKAEEPEAKAKPDSQEAKKPKEEPEPKGEKADSEDETKPKARAADGKFAPADVEGKADAPKAEAASQSEGKHVKAPARLLPSERDVWVNTPRAVQGAFERIEREFEEASVKHKEATEFHEGLRQYADMAKGANTTVKDALDRYVAADKMLAQDFGRGLAHIAQSHGKNPVEAVAQFMRAAGVQPQQLGAYLQGQPAQPQQQAQRPVDPVAQAALQRVQQLEQVLQQQQKAQEVEQNRRYLEEQVLAPAMANMPRFGELQPDIVKLLETGYIDASLSPDVRLREAYFLADRMRPALGNRSEPEADPDTDGKVTPLPRKKQISGSPTASTAKSVKKGPAPSIDEALESALRKATR